MPYCKRCGELGRADKCKKCGSSLLSVSSTCDSNIDRWKSSKYLDHVVGEKEEEVIPRATTKSKLHERRKIPSILFDKKCRIIPLDSCAACHKALSGRLVQLPHDVDGPGKKYHWSCILCHQCRQPFQATGVYLDQHKNPYHLNCAGISPCDEKPCDHCHQQIEDQYLNIHLSVLHPKCFQCTICHQVIKSNSIYSYHQDQIVCRPCHPQTDNDNNSVWLIVPQLQEIRYQQLVHHAGSPLSSTFDDPIQPSELLSSKNYRTHRSLPQFGTVKVCPGCQDRIDSVHDERTGPRAAKWHRQCLVCCSCHKVLDSSAKVHQENDRLVPSCTTCLLQKKNTNQKRNSIFMKEWCKEEGVK